jgi:hypothetical protein
MPLFTGSSNPNTMAKLLQGLKDRVPLGTIPCETDIADAILFILSKAISFITRRIIRRNKAAN